MPTNIRALLVDKGSVFVDERDQLLKATAPVRDPVQS